MTTGNRRPGRHAGSSVVLLALAGCSCLGDSRLVATGLEEGAGFGAMLDGGRGGETVNDQVVTTIGHYACFESLSALPSPPGHNEVFAVARPPIAPLFGPRDRHPPLLVEFPWTGGNDRVHLAFGPALPIPIKFWVLKGPLAQRKAEMVLARLDLEEIWLREGTGLRVGCWLFHDSSGDADADAARHVLSKLGGGDQLDLLHGPAGMRRDEGVLNVYLVETVEDSTSRGYRLSNDTIAIGYEAGSDLLAHELGHAFALVHTNNVGAATGLSCTGATTPCFDPTNVMFEFSDDRQYLSEGQIFRAHLTGISALNQELALRPDLPRRDCDPRKPVPWDLFLGDINDLSACPTLEKRFWADGSWPPN